MIDSSTLHKRILQPVTAGTKDTSRSRYNACKHGILSAETLIEGDDIELYNGFREGFIHQLKPVGELEEFLVNRIVSCAWRLRRVICAESAYINIALGQAQEEYASDCYDDDPDGGWHNFVQELHERTELASLNRYEVSLERSMNRALEQLRDAQGYRLD